MTCMAVAMLRIILLPGLLAFSAWHADMHREGNRPFRPSGMLH